MLLRLDPAGVSKLIENYEKACAGIKKAALTMAWHMRGGASYEDILNMSEPERKQLNELIEYNMEMTKKTGLNYF